MTDPQTPKQFTPSTRIVREAYVWAHATSSGDPDLDPDDSAAQFNRWLSARLARARAEALRELASELKTWHRYETRDIGDAFLADSVIDELDDRADRLQSEVSHD